jgi:DNA-binding XRE family transcriptional regulator
VVRHIFHVVNNQLHVSRLPVRRGGVTKLVMLTPVQLRMARIGAGWSRAQLAKASKTSADTITDFETRGSNPKLLTVMAWRRALEKAGVVFIDPDEQMGPGVRLREGRKT